MRSFLSPGMTTIYPVSAGLGRFSQQLWRQLLLVANWIGGASEMDAINQMVWAVHALRKYHRSSPATRQHVSGSIPRRGRFGRRNGEFEIAFSVVWPPWGYHLLIGLVAFLLGNLFITVIMQITFFDRRIDFACKFTQAVRGGVSPWLQQVSIPEVFSKTSCAGHTGHVIQIGY